MYIFSFQNKENGFQLKWTKAKSRAQDISQKLCNTKEKNAKRT